ncbi:ACP S-malonyltransferase [Magnetospirillum moscoviense]|uniref:ACP S-malonyltransferase n=1 Tax=Magnetospirillum moscoviense TaxID=1437059 RepID=UPI001560F971|nr:ACP S-malonyltransferase [Magnetospirillum moscoviense]
MIDDDVVRLHRPLLADLLGEDPVDGMARGGMDFLSRPDVVSAMVVLVAMAYYHRYRQDGGTCDGVAGYSVGQWTALWAAGIVDAETALTAVVRRGQRLRDAAGLHPGTMVAVIGLSDDVVEAVCAELRRNGAGAWIANYNAPGQLTVSAQATVVEPLMEMMRERGAHLVEPIAVQGAWHCPMMDEAARGFASDLETIVLGNATVAVIDNVTGVLMPEAEVDRRRILADHLRRPVRWAQGIRHLAGLGIDTFVEVGYGDLLTRFGLFIDRTLTHRAVRPLPRMRRKGRPCAE